MHLIERFSSASEATREVSKMLDNKVKIMGFGHRVYRTNDPRNAIVKRCSHKLAQLPDGKPTLYAISEAVEKVKIIFVIPAHAPPLAVFFF